MRVRFIAALIVSILTVACQKEQPVQQHQASMAPVAAPTANQPVQAPVAAAPAPTTPPVPAPLAAAGAIATTDGEQPGVALTVTEFKRSSGDTVTLKFTIANNGSDRLTFGYNFGDGAHGGDFASIGGVHLIDAVNKKKYFVVRDSENRCVCSRDVKDLAPGGRINLWAKFPAPADAQRVTVVVPHFIPMDDVPIS